MAQWLVHAVEPRRRIESLAVVRGGSSASTHCSCVLSPIDHCHCQVTVSGGPTCVGQQSSHTTSTVSAHTGMPATHRHDVIASPHHAVVSTMHFTVMCVWFLVPAVAEWAASLRATHGTTRSLCSSQPRVCSAWEISSTVVSVAVLAFQVGPVLLQVSHCKGSSCHVRFLPFLQCAPPFPCILADHVAAADRGVCPQRRFPHSRMDKVQYVQRVTNQVSYLLYQHDVE